MSEAEEVQETEIIDTSDTGDIETPVDAVEEVEVILEGDDASPEPVPQWVNKRFGRYAKKVKQANSEVEQVKAQMEAIRQENELLRLNAQQAKPKERPNEDDFDTREDYLKADQKWIDERARSIADERFQELNKANISQTTQQQYSETIDKQIDSHYERVASLKMPNYAELEGKAADALGDEVCREILANNEASHLIMAHLGANPHKAQHYKSMIDNGQPIKAVMAIGELGAKLSIKPKNQSTPDPETKIAPGETASTTANERKLEKLRAEAAASGDMSKLLEFKRSLREGVTQ